MKRLFLLITGLALGLRVLQLFHHDIWFDEAFSYLVARLPLVQLFVATGADNNPPLYYLLLHIWIRVFGASPISLRLPSIIFGILLLPQIFRLGKNLGGKQLGQTALVLAAISALLIYFSAEARMYSLITFLALLTFNLWLNYLKYSDWKNGLLFISSFTLSLYTHYYAYMLCFPLLLLLLLHRKPALKPILTLLVPMSLTLPWILYAATLRHPAVFAQSPLIALPATLAAFVLGGTGIVSLRTFFFDPGLLFDKIVFVTTVVVYLFLLCLGHGNLAKSKVGLIILGSFWIPIITLSTVNILLPIFSVRSTILLLPLFILVVSAGITQLPRTQKRMVLVALISLTLSTQLLQFAPSRRGPQLAALAQKTAGEWTLHTSVLTYYPFVYYQQGKGRNILVTPNPLSPITQTYMGGITQSLSAQNSQLLLVEIAGGANPETIDRVKSELEKKYEVLSTDTTTTIRVSRYRISLPKLLILNKN